MINDLRAIFLPKELLMTPSELLTNRLRDIVASVPRVKEKRMFGGITFRVNGKMCINVGQDHLMVRIDQSTYNQLIEHEGCSPAVMKGRAINGFVYVDQELLDL
jgi:TfoX/Sxy family transcriptional regulator of competence genes